jgi:tetratricopeptide (TPR) repeat protein
VQRLGAAAWIAYGKGSPEEALTLMRSAADMEDKSEKSAVTPGRLVPARELLGEMLLEVNRPVEALQAFETSEKHDPNRFRGLYGAAKAAALAGDQAKAKAFYGKLVVLVQNADTERPELKEAKAFLVKQ